jgi:hypothetical protein
MRSSLAEEISIPVAELPLSLQLIVDLRVPSSFSETAEPVESLRTDDENSKLDSVAKLTDRKSVV